MRAADPNLALLENVAEQLGVDLCQQLVFVGGAVVGLLVTDPATTPIRPTQDVDVVCSVTALSDYYRMGEQLRQRGWREDDRSGAPVCRWRAGALAVDVMPTHPDVLGFSSLWYPLALATATRVASPRGQTIRVVTAPVFVALKLEAFQDRGHGNYLFSHDLEDLVAVVDGRESLLAECTRSPLELQRYLAGQVSGLLATPGFQEALPGHLPGDVAGQQRLPMLLQTLRCLGRLGAA